MTSDIIKAIHIHKTKYRFVVSLAINLLLFTAQSEAQLVPLSAQYYTNRYLGNPALAGTEQKLRINANVLKHMSGVSGSPITNSFTADYGFEKVGIGINVLSESESLLRKTRATFSYSYHLPLAQTSAFSEGGQFLHFGISLGMALQYIGEDEIIGDPNDPSVVRYNDRPLQTDGDFGIAYTSDVWTVQLSAPNLRSSLSESSQVADVPIFLLSVSRKLFREDYQSTFQIEPMVCFRGIRGFTSIWDFGTNISFANNMLNVMGIYHSQRSTSLGLVLNFNTKLGFSIAYTTAGSAIRAYSKDGNIEAGLKLGF